MKLNAYTLTDILGITHSTAPKPEPGIKEAANQSKLEPKKVLYSWETLSRSAAKKYDKKFLRTGIIIGVVVCALLLVLQEFFLILAIASILFISYALSHTEPEKIKHEITNHGVAHAGKFFAWEQLHNFFFSKSTGNEVLAVNTVDKLPGRLFFAFDPKDKEKLKTLFETYLNYIDQEPLTFIDRAYFALISKLNIDGNARIA